MERNLYTEKTNKVDINFERPVALSYHECDKIIIINIYVLVLVTIFKSLWLICDI